MSDQELQEEEWNFKHFLKSSEIQDKEWEERSALAYETSRDICKIHRSLQDFIKGYHETEEVTRRHCNTYPIFKHNPFLLEPEFPDTPWFAIYSMKRRGELVRKYKQANLEADLPPYFRASLDWSESEMRKRFKAAKESYDASVEVEKFGCLLNGKPTDHVLERVKPKGGDCATTVSTLEGIGRYRLFRHTGSKAEAIRYYEDWLGFEYLDGTKAFGRCTEIWAEAIAVFLVRFPELKDLPQNPMESIDGSFPGFYAPTDSKGVPKLLMGRTPCKVSDP